MNEILVSLRRLARRTGLFTEAEATNAYNWLWWQLGMTLFLCAGAFELNSMFGMRLPSIYLALVFAIMAFYVWARPLHVLGIAGTGLAAKIVTHKKIAEGVKKVLEIYLELLKLVLIVGGVFLLTTGTFSFKGDEEAGLRLLVALGVVGLFIWKWPDVFVGTWGRRFFYTSALLIAVFSFASIIPGPVWMKYAHWDPANAKTTSTEEALYNLNRAQKKIADEDRAKELERITDRINSRKALTQAEGRFVAEAQKSQASGKPPTVSSKVPLASSPQSEWPTWVIPPDGKSEIVSSPPGMHLVAAGDYFLLHAVYPDGHECSFGQVCGNASEIKNYATNESKETNVVRYAFAPN